MSRALGTMGFLATWLALFWLIGAGTTHPAPASPVTAIADGVYETLLAGWHVLTAVYADITHSGQAG